jgi:hypothetical protein
MGEALAMPVWVAMLGVKPGAANKAVFGDTKGVYFWVAGRAQSEGDFRHLVESEISRRGLSLGEVADVMLADDALKERRGADMDWNQLISSAEAASGLAIDPDFYFYEKPE